MSKNVTRYLCKTEPHVIVPVSGLILKSVFRINIHWIRIQPKILNPDPENLEFLNTIWKKLKLLNNYKIFSSKVVNWKIECFKKSGSSFEFSEFRIRIQTKIPDPGKISGSMRIRIRIQPIIIKYLYFEITQQHPLNSIKMKNINNYLPFSIQNNTTVK